MSRRARSETDEQESIQGVGLLDDLHNFLPAILQEPSRFVSVTDLLMQVRGQVADHFNLQDRGVQRQGEQQMREPVQQRGRSAIPTPIFARASPPPIRRRVATPVNEGPLPTGPSTFDRLHELMEVSQVLSGPNAIEMIRPRSTVAPSVLSALTALLGFGNATITIDEAQLGEMENVVVRPTAAELDHGTTLRSATVQEEATNCSICQDSFANGQAVREINGCHHFFHRTCIENWFQLSVRCPVCRLDIRDGGVGHSAAAPST